MHKELTKWLDELEEIFSAFWPTPESGQMINFDEDRGPLMPQLLLTPEEERLQGRWRKSLNLEELFKDFKIIMLEPNFSNLLEDCRWLIQRSDRGTCANLFALNTGFTNITDIMNGLGVNEFTSLVNFIIFCLALSQRLQEMEDESGSANTCGK